MYTGICRVVTILISLACVWPAAALTSAEAENCVLAIAREMQALPNSREAFKTFVTRYVHIDALTATAVGRNWKNLEQRRDSWRNVAIAEIVEDTIPSLRAIKIGTISRIVVNPTKMGMRVSGFADTTEVNVFIDQNCRILDANAAQVSASGRIRDRIENQAPKN